MSLLNEHEKGGNPLSKLVTHIASTLTAGGTAIVTPEISKSIVGLESLNDSAFAAVSAAADEMRGELNKALTNAFDTGLESVGLAGNEFDAVGMEAGLMLALASENLTDYAQVAYGASATTSASNTPVVSAESAGAGGSLDYRESAHKGLESFDQDTLKKRLPYSIAFNMQATRQDEFGEAHYPTVVQSPDTGCIDISIDFTTVHQPIRHAIEGKGKGFDQTNLLEATVNASVLADESTNLVPYVDAGGANADIFMLASEVATAQVDVAGVKVDTRPLKPGINIDLIGASQNPTLMSGGIMDHTDSLDGRISVNELYFKLGASIIRVDVSAFRRNDFVKSTEGNQHEMELNFRTNDITFAADIKNVAGTVPLALQSIVDGNLRLSFEASFTGHANIQTGEIELNVGRMTVGKVLNENGTEQDLTAGAGLALKTAVDAIAFVGYTAGAKRTNTNRRTRGLLLNNVRETERFVIPLGAPMSAPSPIGADRAASDLESLVNATRVRNSNNAVTKLLNYADRLRVHVVNQRTKTGGAAIEGIARHVVFPFFEEVVIDVSTALNSISSKDKAEDVQAVLVNSIRDVAYRMLRDSGYQAAVDASNTANKKVILTVATDPVIQRHLMISGELRTFGPGFEEPRIVTTRDLRMEGKIVLTLTRAGSAGTVDPLSFGTHAWIPELASTVQVTRDGGTYPEAMVQPRSRHINNVPVMAVIEVAGLSDVMQKVTEQIHKTIV